MTGEIGDVPRRSLSFSVTRREVFRSLTPRGRYRRPADDLPAYRLKTLGALSDEELASITPLLAAGCLLSISEGMIWGQASADEAPQRLCVADPANLLILRAIDGRTSLGAVADQVRQETQLSERSFPYVRALFLELVLAHMATPVQGAEWAK